jgi:hypothetical protein
MHERPDQYCWRTENNLCCRITPSMAGRNSGYHFLPTRMCAGAFLRVPRVQEAKFESIQGNITICGRVGDTPKENLGEPDKSEFTITLMLDAALFVPPVSSCTRSRTQVSLTLQSGVWTMFGLSFGYLKFGLCVSFSVHRGHVIVTILRS